VSLNGRQLSYGELGRRSGRVAAYLRGRGLGPESFVGVSLERSLEQVIALVGIQRSGAAYVALDIEQPFERRAAMLSRFPGLLVLTNRGSQSALPACDSVLLEDVLSGGSSGLFRGPEISASSASYVIFTSGSTGEPKAVVNVHGALSNRLAWMEGQFGLGHEGRVLQKTSFGFDVSVWEFLWPLMTGARLVLARPGGQRDSRYLLEELEREAVTVVHFVPSMLQAFLLEPDCERLQSLRQVMCSGEALSADLRSRFQSRVSAELHNLYGPTEAAIDVTWWDCRGELSDGGVPIGRAISEVQAVVLDGYGGVQPSGLRGELYLGGAGLARGYFGRADFTAERFVPDGNSGVPGARLYRTGDAVRRNERGELEYHGRLDQQVKIRGHRIELGEVESGLRRLAGVREAAVIYRSEGGGEGRLLGYVVSDGSAELASDALRVSLSRMLPEVMVPRQIMVLSALPLTSNGKLDVKGLPEPSAVVALDAFAPPRTALEAELAALWGRVLSVPPPGIFANFLDLGGHSLSALQVRAFIHRTFEVELPMSEFFKSLTVAAQAEAVLRQAKSKERVNAIAGLRQKIAKMSSEERAELLRQRRLAKGAAE